jgi:hypothetical protein
MPKCAATFEFTPTFWEMLSFSRRCNMNRYSAICSIMLQYTVIWSSTFQYAPICGSMFPYTLICGSMSKFALILSNNTIQDVAVCQTVIQYAAFWSSLLQYVTTYAVMLQQSFIYGTYALICVSMLQYITFKYTHTCSDKHHCTQISIRCPNMHKYAPVVEVRLQTPVDKTSLSVPSWGSNKVDSHYPSWNGAVR